MPTDELEPDEGTERLLMTTFSMRPYFLKNSFYVRCILLVVMKKRKDGIKNLHRR